MTQKLMEGNLRTTEWAGWGNWTYHINIFGSDIWNGGFPSFLEDLVQLGNWINYVEWLFSHFCDISAIFLYKKGRSHHFQLLLLSTYHQKHIDYAATQIKFISPVSRKTCCRRSWVLKKRQRSGWNKLWREGSEGGSKTCVSWKFRKAVRYFAHTGKVTNDAPTDYRKEP